MSLAARAAAKAEAEGRAGALSSALGKPPAAVTNARIGMAVFLGSWGMLFTALLFSYAVLGTGAGALDRSALPVGAAAANTVVAAAASALVWLAGRLRRRRPALLACAAALGVLFLLLQAHLLAGVVAGGIEPTAGPGASMLFALVLFHGAHVAVGAGGLAWAAVRSGRDRDGAGVGVELWSAFWHFVGAVWMVIFAVVFLL